MSALRTGPMTRPPSTPACGISTPGLVVMSNGLRLHHAPGLTTPPPRVAESRTDRAGPARRLGCDSRPSRTWMPVVELPALPDDVLEVADALRTGLDQILGDAFASLFLYGAVAFPRPERWQIDFDFHVLLRRPLTDRERRDIERCTPRSPSVSELGARPRRLLRAALRRRATRAAAAPTRSPCATRRGPCTARTCTPGATSSSPVSTRSRSCPSPRGPSSKPHFAPRCASSNRHPDATAFGILNACRILCSFETRDVVMSKYQAAEWALASLPVGVARHHPRRVAAGTRRPRPPMTSATLETNWAPFVDYVNRSLPAHVAPKNSTSTAATASPWVNGARWLVSGSSTKRAPGNDRRGRSGAGRRRVDVVLVRHDQARHRDRRPPARRAPGRSTTPSTLRTGRAVPGLGHGS